MASSLSLSGRSSPAPSPDSAPWSPPPRGIVLAAHRRVGFADAPRPDDGGLRGALGHEHATARAVELHILLRLRRADICGQALLGPFDLRQPRQEQRVAQRTPAAVLVKLRALVLVLQPVREQLLSRLVGGLVVFLDVAR